MSDQTTGLDHLWQQLKSRNVLRVITVYAAAVFGFMELIDIVTGPLHLPAWVLTAVIITSAAGFPLAILVSWLFDYTPDGIKRYGSPGIRREEIKEESEIRTTSDPFSEYTFADGLVHFEEKISKRRHRIYNISSYSVIGLAIVLFIFYSGKSAPFKERDWVVIADFVNHTGEEVFDKSLTTAFEISIDQSRHINVVPRSRVLEMLNLIGQEENRYIDEELCREIALREGARVYIVPEISRAGSNYLLTGKLQEAETGSVYRSEVIQAGGQDEIIHSLDRLSRKMRHFLGESRYSISGQNKPLPKVTTSSLDALKQFALALEFQVNLDFDNAVQHYRNAIELDSSFTMAKVSLGNILLEIPERYDREEGIMWLDEAILTVDDLTDVEKYSLLAAYESNINQDYNKGVEYTRMLIELYPDKPNSYHNLGWYLQNLGKYREAVGAYKNAIHIEPVMLTYGNLVYCYCDCLGEVDSALYWSERMIQFGPDNPWGYYYRGNAYVGRGEFEPALESYLEAREVDPGMSQNLYRLAHTYRLMGRYEEAIDILQELLENDRGESPAHYNLVVNYTLAGDETRAMEEMTVYRGITESWLEVYADNPLTYIWHGLILARYGESEEALEAGRRAIEMDPTLHFRFAEVLAVLDRKEEALDRLEMALEDGYRNLTWIILNPDMGALQDEPRFQAMLEQYVNP